MTVTIITIPSCDNCRTAKMMLDKKGIEYEEIQHLEEFRDTYPIIYMNGKRFNYESFKNELSKM